MVGWLLAPAAGAALPMIDIGRSAALTDIGRTLEILADPEGTLRLDDVRDPAHAGRFTRGIASVAGVDGRTATYWLRFAVTNQQDRAVRRFLLFPHRWINQVTVYRTTADGTTMVRRNGAALPPDPSLPTNRMPVFPLTLEPGETQQLHVRLEGLSFPVFAVYMMSPELLQRFDTKTELLFGMIFGIQLAACAYLLMIRRVSSGSSLPPLLAYIAVSAGFIAITSGFTRDYLPELDGAAASIIGDLTIVGMFFFGLMFARRFLSCAENFPGYDRLLRLLQVVIVALMVLVVVVPHHVGPTLTYFGVFMLVVLVVLTISSIRKGITGARAYLIGWGALLMGATARVALDLGWLPLNVMTANIYYVSLAVTALTLAIGVVERIRLEQLEGQARYQGIVDSALDCILSMDADGRLIEFNPAAEALYGYPRDRAIGQSAYQLVVPPDKRAMLRERLEEYKAHGDSTIFGRRFDTSSLRADGSEFPVEMSIMPAQVEGESFFTAHIRDLTAQKQTEDELERQREALFQTEKLSALGSLLAGVAHELNNPLSIVVGRASMLKESARDDRARTAAEKIHAAAQRCARIVKSFLAMARNRPQQCAPTSLNDVVRSATDLMAYTLRNDQVDMRLELTDDLPTTLADSDQLIQVVINLIANAQHALGEADDPRAIRVITRRRRAGGFEVSVEDSGPGVPADLRGRIFEPFFTTKDVGKGTGLGLSVCDSIARSHGGRLTVGDSALGGAKFTLTLPLRSPQTQRATRQAAPAQQPPRRRILIVEDDCDVGETIAELLRKHGHVADTVLSARTALDLLENGDYDIILSDIRMPDMDGPGLFQAVRDRWPDLARRTVFMTGGTLHGEVDAFVRSLDRPTLEKPVSEVELLSVIDRITRPPARRDGEAATVVEAVS